MVPTVPVSCHDCPGEIRLSVTDVTIRICNDDNSGTYSFLCPTCGQTVVKSAEKRTIDLMIAAGVRFMAWSRPPEMYEPRSGQPINHDDLLDFHALVDDDDQLFAALKSAGMLP